MKSVLTRLRKQLASDPAYFQKVYNHTFDFARTEGQRSLGESQLRAPNSCVKPESAALESAQAFWGLLLPHGLHGGALSHLDSDEDVKMDDGDSWKEQYIQWWFEFLNSKGHKGVSKDTWVMVR